MSCPLRRFDDVKLQTPSRPTNTAAVKELADRLAAMNKERQQQDGMWLPEEPKITALTRDVGAAPSKQKETQRR
jgi:hypothetical protein